MGHAMNQAVGAGYRSTALGLLGLVAGYPLFQRALGATKNRNHFEARMEPALASIQTAESVPKKMPTTKRPDVG
jgi:hypothetical protein